MISIESFCDPEINSESLRTDPDPYGTLFKKSQKHRSGTGMIGKERNPSALTEWALNTVETGFMV